MKKICILFLTILFIKSGIVFSHDASYQPISQANRRVNNKIIRSSATSQEVSKPLTIQLNNCDEQRFADKHGSFSKSLHIQDNGLVDLCSYNQMVFALLTGNPCNFNNIMMGTSPVQRKLANPQAAYAFNLDGPDGWIYTMPAAPSICSNETAGEMVELYWHALLRDVNFNDYDTDASAAKAIDDLNKLSEFKGPKINGRITAQTLFRGNTPGDLTGPLISQFLYQPVPYGPAENFDGGPSGTPGIDFQAQVVPTSSTTLILIVTENALEQVSLYNVSGVKLVCLVTLKQISDIEVLGSTKLS